MVSRSQSLTARRPSQRGRAGCGHGTTMDRVPCRLMAAALVLAVFWTSRGADALGQATPAGESELPPALPDQPPSISGLLASESFRAANPAVGVHAVPLRLGDAVQRSLANVQTIQANIAVRTATVARFEALSNFVPLMTLPQFMSGFSRFTPTSAGSIIDFPEVMGFTQFSGQAPGSTTSRRAGCSSSCRSILPARFFRCRWPRKESVPRC